MKISIRACNKLTEQLQFHSYSNRFQMNQVYAL